VPFILLVRVCRTAGGLLNRSVGKRPDKTGAAAVVEDNRQAWNEVSEAGCVWSIPVSSEVIRNARQGRWQVVLTTKRGVPRDWFPVLEGIRVLCLASGGGQQAPIFAAAGAEVVSLDISEEQLARDNEVAARDGLKLRAIQGNMSDLSAFGDGSFDLVFHPTSNLFVPTLPPVWAECYRVLRPGGALLSGFMNPLFFLFDHDAAKAEGILEVKYPLPYSDLVSLKRDERKRVREDRRTVEFSHSLEAQIGGQIQAGFEIIGFYEDYWDDEATLLNVFSPTSMATRARKPQAPAKSAAPISPA
jgi:SAM-dependent methyltransferase